MKGRDTIEIEHPPGEKIQWDWFERRRASWAAPPMCCWARCRTRAAPAVCGRVHPCPAQHPGDKEDLTRPAEDNQYALAGEGHAPTRVTPPDRLVQRRRAVRAGQDLVPSAASRTAPPPSVGADSVAEPDDSPAIALLKDRHRASAS